MIEHKRMKTVLIIDDDRELRSILGQKLTGGGYRVREAASLNEALTVIGREQVDLIILDLMFPSEHGTSLFAKLVDQKNVSIPVIILSNIERGSYPQTVVDYLIKSETSLDQVVSRIDRFFTPPQVA